MRRWSGSPVASGKSGRRWLSCRIHRKGYSFYREDRALETILRRTGMTYESVFTAKCYLLLWQRRWWYYCPCEICSEPKNISNNSHWWVAKKQKSETLIIQGGTFIMSTTEMFVSWCFLKCAYWIATDGLSSPNPSSESWVGGHVVLSVVGSWVRSLAQDLGLIQLKCW